MRVALLNAHTSYAPGAATQVGGISISEYPWSRRINQELSELLKRNNILAVTIDASHVEPYSRSLSYKALRVSDENADLAVETHMNSFSIGKRASGMEVLYNDVNPDSLKLASCLMNGMREFLPFKVRRSGSGLHVRNNIYLLKHAPCPSAITELLFVSHPVDRLFLLHPRTVRIIANALFTGIHQYIQQES
jgi:N-acetylmuramoyl-L-alanine amidase